MPPPKPLPPTRRQTLYALLRYRNGWPRRFVVTDPSDALLRALEQLCQQDGARLASTRTFLTDSQEIDP